MSGNVNNGYTAPPYKHPKELQLFEGTLVEIKNLGGSSRLTILLNDNTTKIINLEAVVASDALSRPVSIGGYIKKDNDQEITVYRSLTYKKSIVTNENVRFDAP